jgi:sugar transferase (PEP-CTERM/EpsH1 system associated)
MTSIELNARLRNPAAVDAGAPLVAHVLYRFDVGGVENGLVNLINGLPEDRFRHAVISITEHTDFARRIRRPDVALYALHKPPGNSIRMHARLWRLFRSLRPSIVHTRNLAGLEAQAAAWAAGVPIRIHAEQGWDMFDLGGGNRKYQVLRRLFSPFVHQYVTVSRDLSNYLAGPVGIRKDRITQLYDGVDTEKFHPRGRESPYLPAFGDGPHFVVGTVGRMQAVKNPLLLARAFVRAVELMPDARQHLRLAMIGDGPLKAQVGAFLQQKGVSDLAWLPGARDDVAELLRCFDLFVLSSLAEGVSNSIQEAMASALPVVATQVGGNAELVVAGQTGTLVPGDAEALARTILDYYCAPHRARTQGENGRARIVQSFSLETQVRNYDRLYGDLLSRNGKSVAHRAP